jgi:hypothetical protein
LASLPPDVDVPLPLRLDFIELPVVGDVPGVAELAAGSPEVEPRPLGTPIWAFAKPPINTSPVTTTMVVIFMVIPFDRAQQFLIVLLVMAGSLWIMSNLNRNMIANGSNHVAKTRILFAHASAGPS